MTQQVSLSGRAWAGLTLLALLWGASFLAIRIALDEVPVFTSVAHRVGWAAVILWIYVLLRGLPVPRRPRVWAAFAIMGLLNNAVPFSLMAWGQIHIETGLTSILNATSAVFGVLVAALVFADERLSGPRLAGVLLGFAGIVIAIGTEALSEIDLRSLAQFAVLAGALSYAFAGAFARKALQGVPPQIAAMGMLTASAAIMIPLAWMMDGPPSFDLTARTWLAIAYYTVMSTAVAYLLYYSVLALAGAGNLLLVTLMIPPVAILLGALVLGEELAPRAYLGFACLAVGLVVMDGRILQRLRTQKNS